MHSLSRKKKRFSLLFLEEGEIYTRDCMGYRHHRELYPERHQEKGRIHICSRSLIFEPEDPETPIAKYAYRDMTEAPAEIPATRSPFSHTENSTRLSFLVSKVTELPETKNPSPYKVVNLPSQQNILLDFVYETVKGMCDWIKELYTRNSSHSAGFDQDSEIADVVMQHQSGIRFDMSRVVSISEKPLTPVPLLANRIDQFMHIPVLLYITDSRVYLQSIYRVSANPVKNIKISDINKLYKRRWRLRNVGFEFFTSEEKSYFLTLYSEKERDNVFSLILSQVSSECETENSVENMTLKWQLRQISNFDYLLYLNSASYRTFSDFTQYPVFPWVLSNYESDTIDLSDPNNYRDLSKPIGALNPERLKTFLQRYKDMPEPKFLYGTHYSTPGYVIRFLFRKSPLYMLRLHGGKFDSPDRLFNDVASDWKSVLDNPADVKELIPEFYCDEPSFLMNLMGLNLGTKQNGEKVWDVRLPKWAEDPKDFLKKMREALESNYVSENLHHWIDLIFGYKQKGEYALQAHNLFHPLSYEGSVDIDSVSDPVQRKAIEMQINEFGQIPKQLFKIPHPPRSMVPEEEVKESLETPKDSRCAWNIEAISRKSSSKITEITLHKKRVSSIQKLPGKIVTTGHDGCIKLVTLDTLQKRSFNVCELPLSCSALVNEKTVVAGSYNNRLYMFNLGNGRVAHNILAHDDAVTCCEHIQSLNSIASGSWDSHIKIWDVRQKPKPVQEFEEHDEQVLCMGIDKSQGKPYLLATGDFDGKVVVRDLRQGVVSTFETGSQVNTISLSMNSEHLILAQPERVSLFEREGELVSSLEQEGVTSLESDGVFVLSGKEEGELELWELMKGDCLYRWEGISKITAVNSDLDAESFFAGNLEGNIYYIT